ncbi:hypothetical protein ANN_23395 [Periplaneta americana]|uniref:Uncharacterized protein n=1 Tax=Periplaneta americana TaxID=6978 RepID=A0ABQ8SLW0_PERAM|nr:hypothetical protein ANN_23395 [Periplaneta americana]
MKIPELRPIIALFVCAIHITDSARILGLFQFNGKSHFVMFEALLKGLASRGHDVVVVSHFPQESKVPNYTDISVEESLTEAVNSFTMDTALNFKYYNLLKFFWYDNYEFCKEVFEHPNIHKLIKSEEKYDLIITELFGVDCFIGFSHKFKAPLISMISSILLPWSNDRMGNPDNPSYIPSYFLPYTGKMKFHERLWNTLFTSAVKWGSYYFSELPTQELARKYLGEDLPPLNDIARNTSLIFTNSHFSITEPRPMVPGVVEVGGLHLKPPGKLPQNLEKFLNDARHGVIYFSLGSLVRGETMPEDKKRALLDAFSELPQRVVWKTDKFPGLPDNIMTGTWLPQLEIIILLGTCKIIHFRIIRLLIQKCLAYSVLVGRPEEKRPLGRPRRRWEDNIKMDLREVGYNDRQWINLAQDRDRCRAYVRVAMNLRVP